MRKHKFLEESDSYGDDEEFDTAATRETFTSFSQVGLKINKMKHSIKQEGYKALVTVLSTITQEPTESDQAEILTKKALVVIKQVEQFIEKQRLAAEQAEQSRIDTFEEIKTMYTD